MLYTESSTAQYKKKVLMFLTLVPKANFYILRINDWLRAIAVYLLVRTLILAIDHPLNLIVFLYRVKYKQRLMFFVVMKFDVYLIESYNIINFLTSN